MSFAHLKRLVTPVDNGIRDMNQVQKLMNHYIVIFSINKSMVFFTTVMASLSWTVIAALNYSLLDFIVWGIPWILAFGGFWAYFCCGIIVHSFGYFHIVCYYIKLRFELIHYELSELLKNINKYKHNKKVSTNNSKKLLKLVYEYQNVLSIISEYNKFWRKFVAGIYFCYYNVNCVILYQLCYANIDYIIVYILFVLLLIECGFVLLCVSWSAARVSYAAHKSYIIINSFLPLKISLKSKLKVHI